MDHVSQKLGKRGYIFQNFLICSISSEHIGYVSFNLQYFIFLSLHSEYCPGPLVTNTKCFKWGANFHIENMLKAICPLSAIVLYTGS